MRILRLLTALAAGLGCASVGAAVAPDNYSMPNGSSGTHNYWDESYNGSGCSTCNGAFLSGGTGDLTDGIIATDNWFVVEAPAGNGPYVGWQSSPTITFHWDTAVTVNSATFYLDDADGNGGVSAPASIVVDGNTFPVSEPAGPAPFAFTASGLSFSGNNLAVTLNPKTTWVFLSEVQFDAAAVIPEPGSYALLLAGLGLLGFAARRHRTQK